MGKNIQKSILQAKTEEKKTFSYELDGVQFNVTLRIDVKKELVAMREILVRNLADVDNELLKFKK